MSKVAVVYFSQTGNTEAMAKAVAEGAGSEAVEFSSFDAGTVGDYDAFAFGCPAMGSEELDPTLRTCGTNAFRPWAQSQLPCLARTTGEPVTGWIPGKTTLRVSG